MKKTRDICLYCAEHYDLDTKHECRNAGKEKMLTGHSTPCEACRMPTRKQVLGPIKAALTQEVHTATGEWNTMGSLKDLFPSFEAYLVERILLRLNQLRGIDRAMTIKQLTNASAVFEQWIADVKDYSKTGDEHIFFERMRANCVDARCLMDDLGDTDEEGLIELQELPNPKR